MEIDIVNRNTLPAYLLLDPGSALSGTINNGTYNGALNGTTSYLIPSGGTLTGIDLQTLSSGKLLFSLGGTLTTSQNTNFNNPSVADYGTRWDKVEMTYSAAGNSGSANLTATDFFGFELTLQTYNGSGVLQATRDWSPNLSTAQVLANLATTYSTYFGASVTSAAVATGPSGLAVPGYGNVLRVIAPSTLPASDINTIVQNPTGWPTAYVSYVMNNHITTEVKGTFDGNAQYPATTYDFFASIPTTPGNGANPGDLLMIGTGIDAGQTIDVPGSLLATYIISCNPNPYILNGQTITGNPNNQFGAALRDILGGFNFGFVGSNEPNPANNGTAFGASPTNLWYPASNAALTFAAAQPNNPNFYNQYAAAVAAMGDAYGFPYSDLLPGSTNPLAPLQNIGTTVITIMPDTNSNPPASYTIAPNPGSVDDNGGSLGFTITRSSTSQAATVYVSTLADQGFSNAPNYYVPLTNVPVNFAAGQASAQVAITINDLGLTSGSETFRLVVQQAPNSTVLASAPFTIINTDNPTFVTVSGAGGTQALVPFLIRSRAAVAQQGANIVNDGVAAGQILPVTIPSGSAIPTVPGGKSGLFIKPDGGAVTLPGSYSAFSTATDASAPISVTGGSVAGQFVIAGTAGLSFTAGSGTGSVMAGGGNNLVNLPSGSGSQYVYLGGGADTVQATGGQQTVDAGPGNNFLNLGTGTDYVVSSGIDTVVASGGAVTVNGVAGSSALVFSGTSALFFSGSGNTATVAAGTGSAAGADTIFANGGGGQFYGGSGQLLFVGGSGASTAVGGSGTSVLFGGSSGRDLLVAGQGSSTVVGTPGMTVVGGVSSDVLVAGIGNESLVAGSGSDVLFGNTGTVAMFGGTGADTMVAAAGTAEMVGGTATDLFAFVNGAGGGNNTIWNFTHGQDHAALFGYGTNIIPGLINSAVVSGSATTITLSDHTTITFGNIGQLTASDLIAV